MNDLERFSARLSYDPDTGDLCWRDGPNAGKRAGHMGSQGYFRLRIGGKGGKNYASHRMAWLLHYGEWPKGEVDHINRVRSDNRILNLRDVTRNENEWNQGALGVSRNKNRSKWIAYISYNGIRVHLGYFECFGQAVSARQDAAKRRELLRQEQHR